MTYEELVLRLENITTTEHLHDQFENIALFLHREIPTFDIAQRYKLTQKLLALTLLCATDATLKKQFNDLFQQILLAPSLKNVIKTGSEPKKVKLLLGSFEVTQPLPKEVFEHLCSLLENHSEKNRLLYCSPAGKMFILNGNQDNHPSFIPIPCTNEAYLPDQLKTDLLLGQAPLAADSLTRVAYNDLSQAPDAIKYIAACTNFNPLVDCSFRKIKKNAKEYASNSPWEYNLYTSEKIYEPMQLNYQYQETSLSAWDFLHELNKAGLLKESNFKRFVLIGKNGWLSLQHLYYAIEMLTMTQALSQGYLNELVHDDPYPSIDKAQIDLLFHRLRDKASERGITEDEHYNNFGGLRDVLALFLRVAPSNDVRRYRDAIITSKICSYEISGDVMCNAVQHLLRVKLLDTENCKQLFQLPGGYAFSLITSHARNLIVNEENAPDKIKFNAIIQLAKELPTTHLTGVTFEEYTPGRWTYGYRSGFDAIMQYVHNLPIDQIVALQNFCIEIKKIKTYAKDFTDTQPSLTAYRNLAFKADDLLTLVMQYHGAKPGEARVKIQQQFKQTHAELLSSIHIEDSFWLPILKNLLLAATIIGIVVIAVVYADTGNLPFFTPSKTKEKFSKLQQALKQDAVTDPVTMRA